MSSLTKLARPYAQAVYQLAKETGTKEQWSQTLAFLSIAVRDPDVSRAVDNPKVARQDLLKLLLDVGEGYLTEEGKNLVRLLIESGRLKLAGELCRLYEQYRAEDEGYIEIEATTAYPLDSDEEALLKKALEAALGREVRLRSEEDSSLIGGVLVRAGDQVIDGSVRGQLQQLAKRLQS